MCDGSVDLKGYYFAKKFDDIRVDCNLSSNFLPIAKLIKMQNGEETPAAVETGEFIICCRK